MFIYQDEPVVAILAKEVRDSFLVVFPMFIHSDDGQYTLQSVMPSPFVRLLKTQVGAVCTPPPVELFCYLTGITTQSEECLRIFGKPRLENVLGIISILRQEYLLGARVEGIGDDVFGMGNKGSAGQKRTATRAHKNEFDQEYPEEEVRVAATHRPSKTRH